MGAWEHGDCSTKKKRNKVTIGLLFYKKSRAFA